MIKLFQKINHIYTWCRTVIPIERRNIFVVYGIILLATSLDNLNSGASITMSRNIQEKFNSDSSTTSWQLSAYALTLGSFIMVSGKIGDVIGSHNLFLMGINIVWICALINACIPHNSIIVLIVFRAIQGIGASFLVPSMMSLTANYFTGDRLKYLSFAIIGMIITLTSTLGLGIILGGAFSLTSIGYQSFFYYVFAFGLICNILLLFLIIPIEKTEGHNKLSLKNIDYIAAFLSIVGLLLIILGLTEGGENWKSPKAIAPLIIGFFTFLSSLIFEGVYIKRYRVKHSSQDPDSDWRLRLDLLFPPELVQISNFLVFLLVCGIYYATFVMITIVGVEYYTLIEHNSSLIAALKVFPISFGLIFGGLVYRESYYKKIGFKNMFILSAILSLCGVIWYSRTNYNINNSYWKYGFISLFMYAYGINIFFNIYFKVVVESTPLHLQGVVNGIFQTCSQVLLAVGNALVPSILGNIDIAYTNEEKQKLHDKFQIILYVVMGFHVAVLIIMVLFYKDKTNKNSSNDEIKSTEMDSEATTSISASELLPKEEAKDLEMEEVFVETESSSDSADTV
jgi:MFS family permease